MSKIALFFPTYRPGGLDVFEASINRQTLKPDVIYIADKKERESLWGNIAENLQIKIKLLHVPIRLGDKRNLAKGYNMAADLSIKDEVDLLISLQDYIWIPEFGIERFAKIHDMNSNALVTGITHISKDPLPEQIEHIKADYSIFKEPFYGKPEEIEWEDVRLTQIYDLKEDANIFPCMPGHWEANWASVPVGLFEAGCYWDEEYDKGIAYENQDFAMNCEKVTGCDVMIDAVNQAISLPHKKYFDGEEEEIVKYSNRWMHEAKWD